MATRLLFLPSAELKPQALATTAWALAILRVQAPPVMQQISEQATGYFDSLQCKPRDLTTLAWAFASMLVQDAPFRTLLFRMSHRSPQPFDAFGAIDLASFAWSLATLEWEDARLLTTFAAEVHRKMEGSQFPAQAISNIAWALAVFHLLDLPLMATITR